MQKSVPGILRLTLKAVLGLLAVLFVAALLLLWRLSSGPLQLNQLVPRIERAASDLPGGLSVRLKGIDLYWRRAERHVDLRATSVELVDSSGTSLVSVPEVDISLSGLALLRGVVALSSVELRNFDMQLVRDEDGSFQVFNTAGAAGQPGGRDQPWNQAAFFQQVFKVLASDGNPDFPLSYLKRLKIRGSMQIEDRKNGFKWSASQVDSQFNGHDGEVKGQLNVTFSSPAALQGIHSDVTLSLRDDTVAARLEFTGVKPAGFAALDQRLAALEGLDISLDGSIDTSLTLPGTFQRFNASLRAGPGQFSLGEYYPRAFRIDALDMNLSADLPARSVQVSTLDLQLGEAAEPLKLQLKGTLQQAEEALAISLGTELQGLKPRDFDSYWPRGVAEGARGWLVKNLQAGVVDKANLDLVMQVPIGTESGFRLDELKGNVDFRDLTVAYFGELPAATGVTGGGSFDRHGFDLGIRAGQVNGVDIESGQVLISGLDDRKAAISVRTHLAGPVAGVIATLEAPPLNLGARAFDGRVSERLEGRIEADFGISLPLRPGLENKDIDYQAKGRITGGMFREIFTGFALQDATVDFNLDPSKVTMTGPLAFAGIHMVVDWTSHLAGPAMGQADFTVDAPHITSAQVDGLGFRASDYMQGAFQLKSEAKLLPGGRLTASIEADFNDASLAVPIIRWKKNTGEAGKVTLDLAAEKKHLHASGIKVDLGQVSTGGNVEFDLAGPVVNASIEHLSLPVARIDGLKLQRSEAKILGITVAGGEASLESFLSGGARDSGTGKKPDVAMTRAAARPAEKSGLNLEIGPSALDKVFIDKDTRFDRVTFSARRDDKGWQSLSVSGHNPSATGPGAGGAQTAGAEKLAPGQFSLVYGPAENGRYPVHLEAENLGAMISAIAGKEVMDGGYLALDGDSEGPFLTRPVKATFELDSFTIKHAPGIVSVLNMASLTQIVSTLTQTGLAFRSAAGDIELDGTLLTSRQIKMTGGSLGLFAGGQLDMKSRHVNIGGTVVPLHKINAIVGKVPLLGQVVAGKDGQGIMAVDYKLTGELSQPEVEVSRTPLTQGVLQILDEDAGDIDAARR